MKRTSFLAILMAFVCFGLYSCSSDPLEESRDPATRAATAGFDELSEIYFLLAYEYQDVNVPGGVRNRAFDIYTNTEWRVVSAPDFIFDYKTSGSNSYNFRYATIQQGPDEYRTGELIFEYYDNGLWRTAGLQMSIEGTAGVDYFNIGEIPRFDCEGGEIIVPVNTWANWEVSSLSDWLQVSTVYDMGYDSYLIFLYAFPFNGYSRQGELEFRYFNPSSNSWLTFKEIVYQDGPREDGYEN